MGYFSRGRKGVNKGIKNVSGSLGWYSHTNIPFMNTFNFQTKHTPPRRYALCLGGRENYPQE